MNTFHIFIMILKFIFAFLLLLINFNIFFTKDSPVYIFLHYTLIICLSIYMIVITFPIRQQIAFEREDYLFIIIISLMLLKTVKFEDYLNSIKNGLQNVKDLVTNAKNKHQDKSSVDSCD